MIFKKIISLFTATIICTLSLCRINSFAADKPDVSALAAVLISADTGEIIFSKNSDKKLPMASTTKIMTALLLLESGNLNDPFIVDNDAIKVEGSSMGLKEGDVVTKYALCCGMLLPSGNDAANASAVCVAGNIENFLVMMNKRAKKIGMSKTYFASPSGLDADGHGSSAYDMALLAREALKNKTFRDICGSSSIKLHFGNPPYDRWLKNTNRLLNMYDGVYGVKTGFTDAAGRCLVSACKRDGKNLICVTLNDKNDWNDHMSLYDFGFKSVSSAEFKIPDTLSATIAGGTLKSIKLKSTENPIICTCDVNFNDFSYKIIAPPFIYAPVNANQQLGELYIYYKNKTAVKVPLYAAENCCSYSDSHKTSHKKFSANLKDTLHKLLKPLIRQI